MAKRRDLTTYVPRDRPIAATCRACACDRAAQGCAAIVAQWGRLIEAWRHRSAIHYDLRGRSSHARANANSANDIVWANLPPARGRRSSATGSLQPRRSNQSGARFAGAR